MTRKKAPQKSPPKTWSDESSRSVLSASQRVLYRPTDRSIAYAYTRACMHARIHTYIHGKNAYLYADVDARRRTLPVRPGHAE